jgi:parallel beta-helix repeat protein
VEHVSGEWNHHGVYLSGGHHNCLFHNLLKENKVGIECYGSFDNTISENDISYNTYQGVMIDGYSERNCIHGNNLIGNGRGVVFHEVSYNGITNNTFRENNQDVYLEILQYLEFNLRKLPCINGNYWGRSRLLPKVLLGHFTYVYMDVPFGGYIRVRCPFIDWHPAQQPYGTT